VSLVTKVEWTGEANGWDAFNNIYIGLVGIHWDKADSSWLWVHEGSHGVSGPNEQQAIARANYCMMME
jgi:hypothetical protein